jgi:hypothetical protein
MKSAATEKIVDEKHLIYRDMRKAYHISSIEKLSLKKSIKIDHRHNNSILIQAFKFFFFYPDLKRWRVTAMTWRSSMNISVRQQQQQQQQQQQHHRRKNCKERGKRVWRRLDCFLNSTMIQRR